MPYLAVCPGMKASSSLNERLQTWLTCPAAQLLMEISAHCFSKLYVESDGIHFQLKYLVMDIYFYPY